MKEKPSILVVDDEEIVRESLAGWLAEDGYQVETAPDGPTAIGGLATRAYAVLLVDLKMPGMDGLAVLAEVRRLQPDASVIIMTAYATVDTAVQAMKQGAHDYLVKPFEPEELSVMVGRLTQQQALRTENILLRRALQRQLVFRELISKSPKMEAVFELARAAATGDSPVLLLGERGTGRKLLARAIHAESPRREGPFVGVSCAAVTDDPLERELFGSGAGAVTGTGSTSRGKFEVAAGGTLCLDEVGEISTRLQLELLRVLEGGELRRVGGRRLLPADVRVIATSHRDLKQRSESGAFRQELYTRLSVIPITLPPLRERKEDIPLLVDHFLRQFRTQAEKPLEGVSAEAMELFLGYEWPGNVRELRNVLERASVLVRGPILTPTDLEFAFPSLPVGERGAAVGADSLREVERRHIASTLKAYGWNISRSAKALGIDRVTLYNKIKRYHIREDG